MLLVIVVFAVVVGCVRCVVVVIVVVAISLIQEFTVYLLKFIVGSQSMVEGVHS